MKAVLKIVMYLMLLVLLTAEDCGMNNNNNLRSFESVEDKMYRDLEADFVSEELDNEHLRALEKRSVQKLEEFGDLLNIYADSLVNVQFRKQARQVISEAFISEELLQVFWQQHNLYEDIENYLLLGTNRETVKLEVKKIRIDKSFVRSGLDYQGQLAFQVQNSTKIIGVRATKATKIFGNEKLQVWEVFFEL